MHIDIQALDFTLTDALRERVRRRMGFAFGGRDEHIQRVEVRLSDINGPKGGEDMCCHVRVLLGHMPEVVVKDIQADLYIAIDRAVDRAGRSVARQLSRRITQQRAPTPISFELPELS